MVATEGRQTESIYFSLFSGDAFRKNIHLRLLPSRGGDNDPKRVLKRLKEFARAANLQENDQLWVVVDVDEWQPEVLTDLCKECKELGYSAAVSNPCFELWLVLHQEKQKTPSALASCEKELTKLLGSYSKSKYDPSKLRDHIESAITHARRIDTKPETLWPNYTATRVYKLVQELLRA